MTLNTPITPAVEVKLRECAAASGKDVVTLVQEAVAEKLADFDDAEPTSGRQELPAEELIAPLRRFAASHRPLPFEADDSRESIYAGRGE